MIFWQRPPKKVAHICAISCKAVKPAPSLMAAYPCLVLPRHFLPVAPLRLIRLVHLSIPAPPWFDLAGFIIGFNTTIPHLASTFFDLPRHHFMLPNASVILTCPDATTSLIWCICWLRCCHFSLFDWRIFYCQPASLHLTRPLFVALQPLFDSVSIIVVCHLAISYSAGVLVSLSPFLHLADKVISSSAISYCLAGTFVICCTTIYIIWLADDWLPSYPDLILPASTFIAVLPFLIWLVNFWLLWSHICIWLAPLLVATAQHLH